MLRLRLLGSLAVESQSRPAAPALIQKPKRFALLSYLAVRLAQGPHRRDTLIALLWPEFNQRRARAALNRTLYDLRRELGDGVVVSLGNEEVGLEPERVWCDVVAFEEALAAGDRVGALDLYRGELMPGFFLSGTPEFERWLDLERARLRDRALRAALEQAETSSDPVRWLRRAREIEPDDERVVRRLLSALAESGDRAGALREYEAFARRLVEDFGAEPSPETRELVEAIRKRSVAASGAPAAGSRGGADSAAGGASGTTGEPGAGGTPSAASPSGAAPDAGRQATGDSEPATAAGATGSDAAAAEDRAGRRRWRGTGPGARLRWWGSAAVVAVLVVIGALAIRSSGLGEATRPNLVAVLPFAFRGDPELAYLGEGIATLLAHELDALPGTESVDPRTVLATTNSPRDGTTSPREGRDLAARLGAGQFVLGDVLEAGGRVRLNASLYGGRGGAMPRASVSVEGRPDSIFDLVREVAIRLFERSAGDILHEGAAPATRSMAALEAFVYGDQALRAARFAEAQSHFQRAVRADTAFGLAYLRLSQAANWTGADWLARSAAEDAIRHRAGLSARDRRFAEAWRAYVFGRADEAERGFRALVAEDSLDADAWFYLGETLFHWGPTYGWPAAEARNAFGRVLDLSPDNVAAIIHVLRLAANDRDLARIDTLTRRLQRLEPTGDHALEGRVLRAWVAGDTAEQQRLRNELRTVDHTPLWHIALSAAAHGSDPGATLKLVPLLRPAPDLTAGDPKGHVEVRLYAAILEAARGRFAAANAWLDSVAAIDPAKALEYRGLFAITPYDPLGEEARAAIRRGIERYRAPGPMLPTMPLNPPVRTMLAGILAARSGDMAGLERALRSLATPAGGGIDSQFHVFRLRGEALLRAEAALAAQDPASALRALESFPLAADSTLPVYDREQGDAHMRWLRARVLETLGQDEEALRWYATFPDPAANDLMYLAPSHLHRARIHERRGERVAAVEHYARVVELWRDADPRLQPLVEEARAALRRLGSGR